jgi:hypothetical protein
MLTKNLHDVFVGGVEGGGEGGDEDSLRDLPGNSPSSHFEQQLHQIILISCNFYLSLSIWGTKQIRARFASAPKV